ncbi:BPSL0761 family protein [Pseudomonas sp. ZS1P83]
MQTRKFLIKLSHDKALPDRVRSDAKHLLRHFPTVDDMILAGSTESCSRGILSSRFSAQ